jgi:hypothetical protein
MLKLILVLAATAAIAAAIAAAPLEFRHLEDSDAVLLLADAADELDLNDELGLNDEVDEQAGNPDSETTGDNGCDLGQYFDDGVCKTCDERTPATSYGSKDGNICSECDAGYTFDVQTKTCVTICNKNQLSAQEDFVTRKTAAGQKAFLFPAVIPQTKWGNIDKETQDCFVFYPPLPAFRKKKGLFRKNGRKRRKHNEQQKKQTQLREDCENKMKEAEKNAKPFCPQAANAPTPEMMALAALMTPIAPMTPTALMTPTTLMTPAALNTPTALMAPTSLMTPMLQVSTCKQRAAQSASPVACKAGTAVIRIASSAPATRPPARARPAVVPTATATARMPPRARVSHAPTFAVLSMSPRAFALRCAPLAKLVLSTASRHPPTATRPVVLAIAWSARHLLRWRSHLERSVARSSVFRSCSRSCVLAHDESE